MFELKVSKQKNVKIILKEQHGEGQIRGMGLRDTNYHV